MGKVEIFSQNFVGTITRQRNIFRQISYVSCIRVKLVKRVCFVKTPREEMCIISFGHFFRAQRISSTIQRQLRDDYIVLKGNKFPKQKLQYIFLYLATKVDKTDEIDRKIHVEPTFLFCLGFTFIARAIFYLSKIAVVVAFHFQVKYRRFVVGSTSGSLY